MLDFMIATPKRHILARRNRVFWHILRQNRSSGLGCSELHDPPPPKKTEKLKKTSRVNTFGAQSYACAETKPLGESYNDVITSENFYDCRLWGLSVEGFLH